jgi:hypothetical protein
MSYASTVNTIRIVCKDGTIREPSPNEVRALVKSCARVRLDGERAPSCPDLRAAHRAGELDDAVMISRRLDRTGAVAHSRRIVAETVSLLVA